MHCAVEPVLTVSAQIHQSEGASNICVVEAHRDSGRQSELP